MKTRIKYELETCGRCGGTGSYSYNSIDGDKCYGCNGKGETLTKEAAEVANEVAAIRKELRQVLAADMQVGDRIAWGKKWTTLQAIEHTDEACGWTVGVDGEKKATAYWVHATFNDEAHKLSGLQIMVRAITREGLLRMVDAAKGRPGVVVAEVVEA